MRSRYTSPFHLRWLLFSTFLSFVTNGLVLSAADIHSETHYRPFLDLDQVPGFQYLQQIVHESAGPPLSVVATTILAFWGYFRWRTQIYQATQKPLPDNPYDLAALTGGAQRLTQTAMIKLARSGIFTLGGEDGKEIVVADTLDEHANEIEWALYKEAARTQPVRVIQLVQAGDCLRPVQDTVWALPSIPTASRPSRWWTAPLSVVVGILSLVFADDWAKGRHHDDPNLPILLGIAWVLNLSFAVIYGRRGNARKIVIGNLRKRHAPLGLTPGWLTPDVPPRDWAMAVALYGPPVLKGTMLHDYVALFGYIP